MDDNKIIQLFGYEKNGGKNSILWQNPMYFSRPSGQAGSMLDEALAEWKASKRQITIEEVTSGKWIKHGDHGHSFEVEFASDFTLKERSLDGGEWWSGKWELVGVAVKMQVGKYMLHILANKNGNEHSGIESEVNGYHPTYFRIQGFPIKSSSLSMF